MAVPSSAPEYARCQLFAFYRRLDEDDDFAALPHLENVLAHSSKFGKPLRSAVFLEAASACARIRHQTRQALAWRERAVLILPQKAPSLVAVDASIAMSEEHYDDALKLCSPPVSTCSTVNSILGSLGSPLARWATYQDACRTNIDTSRS